MYKIIVSFLLTVLFTSCSLKKEKNKNYTFHSCTVSSYTKSLDTLFIEYINLDISCNWTALPRSYFEELYKNSLGIKNLSLIESLDYDEYQFNTYLIDNKYYMNLIWQSKNTEEKFILDNKGLYFDKLIRTFNKNYKNISLDKKRFTKDYNTSLVENNILGSYFISELSEEL